MTKKVCRKRPAAFHAMPRPLSDVLVITRASALCGLREVSRRLGWSSWVTVLAAVALVAGIATVSVASASRIVTSSLGFQRSLFRIIVAVAFVTGGLCLIGLRSLVPQRSELTLQLELLPVKRWVVALATSGPVLAGSLLVAVLSSLQLLAVAATVHPTWLKWVSGCALLGAIGIGIGLAWGIATLISDSVEAGLRRSAGFLAVNAGAVATFAAIVAIGAYDVLAPNGWWHTLAPAGAFATAIDPSATAAERAMSLGAIAAWTLVCVLLARLGASRSRHTEDDHDACLPVATGAPIPRNSFLATAWIDCLQLARTPQYLVGLCLSVGALAILIVTQQRIPGVGAIVAPLIPLGPYLGTLQLVGRNVAHRWVGHLTVANGSYWRLSSALATLILGTLPATAIAAVAVSTQLLPVSMIATTATAAVLVWIATLVGSTVVPYLPTGGGATALTSVSITLFVAITLGTMGFLAMAGIPEPAATVCIAGAGLATYWASATERTQE
ncbi:hypothetical protein [Microlunatus sp. GCM10028923]|uniref:hypothetical protein n=1 Tax=Microlunatus sp. GCM10028923 TaxID=3273400 RepID=UPI00360F92D3